jgi:predicted kinase
VAKDAEKVLLSPEDRREAHEAELRRRKYLVWQRKAAEAAVRRQYIALSNSWGYQSPYIWVPSPPQPPDLYILPPVYSHR